ncbi:hydroxysqualene dehydroxylase [Streptomyces griseocarneus]|uniref:hydroxysqualene dehydroxylase n=1 Tax=Streptomyces griseocarneus TaxID=51201 RepID=UPI00167D9240|nr:FAD-dependent oxidoreductase [Streptomyces griseocarneus]MBZ6472779.1 FAD-dependent oxidoreductase [Streptomyces griseocarneus]GHG47285.1 phytoene dehydrogenase [Streptomyces griseocarneus]
MADGTGSSTRRRFIGGATAVAAATALGTGEAQAASRPARRSGARSGGREVAVLGGGVAGLTAAHELAERGFRVTVYERKSALGGKARSMDVPGSARGGRRPLPGEHGFRFIPGFYRNLPDTLRRIPFPGNPNGCHDNLVPSTEVMLARTGGLEDIRIPFASIGKPPPVLTPDVFLRMLTAFFETFAKLPAHEIAYFAGRLLVWFTSGERRRTREWERVPWFEFTRAARMSANYRQLLAVGITRNIVATKAEVASTKTVATCIEAFLFNALGRGADGEPDRVLNAPTNEAWIDPWVAHLRSLGVEFRTGWGVRDLQLGDGRIAGAVLEDAGGARRTVGADHFVSAMPVEHARTTWNARVRAADPGLARCDRLETDWMTGIQFYLTEPTPILHGHINHIDSPWSITSVSQAQYWSGRDFRRDYGDGAVADCLSVDVSEWDRPGILYGKTAKRCTREEVAREVWAQMKAGLNDTGRTVLKDSALHSWFLDPAVELGGSHATNDEQLLIHPTGTWFNRPEARTAIPNLFLAGDYVAVDIDLATMEGANASARAAVNALLDATGSPAGRCAITPLYRAPEFEPLRHQDDIRHRLGLRNAFDLG